MEMREAEDRLQVSLSCSSLSFLLSLSFDYGCFQLRVLIRHLPQKWWRGKLSYLELITKEGLIIRWQPPLTGVCREDQAEEEKFPMSCWTRWRRSLSSNTHPLLLLKMEELEAEVPPRVCKASLHSLSTWISEKKENPEFFGRFCANFS